MGKKIIIVLSALAAGLFYFPPARAQQAGPVIPDYGKVYRVTNPDIPSGTETMLQAVFDVYDNPGGSGDLNPHLETAARFLNLHVQSGFSAANLQVALVVHGDATEDLLKPEIYREKHGTESQNARLVRELISAGVQVTICGQSAAAREISREQTIPGVKWALSAMSALVYYQDEGYQFIKF